MSKKNKMISIIDHLEAFVSGLPVGFTIESFYQHGNGNGVTLTLSAPTVGALKDVAPKVKTENGYHADTILHSAAASVDNGETNYSLNLQCVERFNEFALVFEGRTGVQSPGALPLGTHAYLDGKHKPYGISEDTAYTFHVHPAHLVAFEHWTDASGVEVLREVEREADEVA